MRVGIIGSGPSGLFAIKSCIKEGYEITAFEQNPEVGGEWYSTGEIGKNKYGIDVHSKIYEGLMTNVPKEAMAFSDFPFEDYGKSYLTQKEVFKYFQSYADAFKLRLHIKFKHQVIRARPLINDKWEIIAKDLPKNEYKTYIFDALFICIGISAPLMPKIEGHNDFKGQLIHSRDYRNTSLYENKKVLLIGSGTSSLDMVIAIGKVADKVSWVHKIKEKHGISIEIKLPESVIEMPNIKKITSNGAEFDDGTSEEFDLIVFATGYDFTFPFLSVDSGVYVTDKSVYPLYKHCININKPTMMIIGLPFFALGTPMFELQIKFCLEFLSGRKFLPPKKEMLSDSEEYAISRRSSESVDHKAHYLGLKKHESYYRDLAESAEIEPMKPVFAKILNHSFEHMVNDYLSFRNYNSRILNEHEFECDCAKNE